MELALSIGGESTQARQENNRRWFLSCSSSSPPRIGIGTPVQLDLKLSCFTDLDCSSDSKGSGGGALDINEIPLTFPLVATVHDYEAGQSSSASLPADISGKRGDCETDAERGSSKCSDEEEGEGGQTRKKLRLSKEQSCYLEESFKEHPTLNPKQKMALAKQLNLRPRQVEVWFQNRRARTKLKQTEVDCEYLKRCCESLTEENRRLHKELQDLKALKSPNNPFNLHGPATTLTMCPSCERVSTTTSKADNSSTKLVNFGLLGPKSRFYPFSQHTSAAS